MKVLVVHNSYQQRGGEDQVFESEADLLVANGHQVELYRVSNDSLEGGPFRLAASTTWNHDQYRKLLGVMRSTAPDIVHAHNTFPLISPSVYYAARSCGIPVIQTLHNYRLLCPSATLFRSGKVCEACLGKSVAWPGILHGCYRNSKAATAAASAMLSIHRFAGTWTSVVNHYIVLNEFSKGLFVRAGFPAEKLSVKPNFVHPDPGFVPAAGHRAVFVGRLTTEKGIGTLLEAWRAIGSMLPLDIIGDGPLGPLAADAAENIPGVRWLKWLPREEVFKALREAYIAVVPSHWYEPFGMIVAEAFAVGVPVLASASGGLEKMVESGRTGLLFQPGDATDLKAKVLWAAGHPDEIAEMRGHARREFERNYTASDNYKQLLHIYRAAARSAKRGEPARAEIPDSRRASAGGAERV